MSKQERTLFWFVIILIALSRIPFLFYGYGSEEDAWALPLVAERIATTGNYEVSRLPGHPFQEIAYSLIWNSGSVYYNLITLIISTSGIACFMLFLKKLNLQTWLWVGIGIAATPIFYINSTNDLDYTWALGFILISFYLAIKNKPLLAGLFIACAIGCRITSGAMLLPLMIILWHCTLPDSRFKNLNRLVISSIVFSALIFVPVFNIYGFSFFTYYEHFPIPGFFKNFYKGTIAVWGIIGLATLIMAFTWALFKRKIFQEVTFENKNLSKEFLLVCLVTIALYVISFLRMPLKAAFMIPIIPFVIAGLSLIIPFRFLKVFVILLIVSTFSFGINLSDPLRGSKESKHSIQKNIGGQKIVVDPFVGLLMADITKRQQRTAYSNNVLSKTKFIKNPTYIIAGWWLADLLVLQRENENKMVNFGYYTDEPDLLKYKKEGKKLFYLPEQDSFNDLRFRKTFTHRYADSFLLDSLVNY